MKAQIFWEAIVSLETVQKRHVNVGTKEENGVLATLKISQVQY